MVTMTVDERPRLDRREKISRRVADLNRRFSIENLTRQARNTKTTTIILGERSARFLVNPPKLDRFTSEVTRFSQWMAFFLLPFLIVVTLPILVAFNDILAEVLLQNIDPGGQLAIMRFIVTFITLGAFCLSAWFWFLWVRTGGFKLFGL